MVDNDDASTEPIREFLSDAIDHIVEDSGFAESLLVAGDPAVLSRALLEHRLLTTSTAEDWLRERTSGFLERVVLSKRNVGLVARLSGLVENVLALGGSDGGLSSVFAMASSSTTPSPTIIHTTACIGRLWTPTDRFVLGTVESAIAWGAGIDARAEKMADHRVALAPVSSDADWTVIGEALVCRLSSPGPVTVNLHLRDGNSIEAINFEFPLERWQAESRWL